MWWSKFSISCRFQKYSYILCILHRIPFSEHGKCYWSIFWVMTLLHKLFCKDTEGMVLVFFSYLVFGKHYQPYWGNIWICVNVELYQYATMKYTRNVINLTSNTHNNPNGQWLTCSYIQRVSGQLSCQCWSFNNWLVNQKYSHNNPCWSRQIYYIKAFLI